MKRIKVKFVDFWPNCKPEELLIYERLCQYYDVDISDSPEYVIYSVFGSEHLQYSRCIKIFMTGENLSADFNLCDYAVGFDEISFNDRYHRMPLFYNPIYLSDLELCQKKHIGITEDMISKKTEFCSFVVSNGNAVSLREDAFYALSAYKKVNSGGRYKNNVGLPNGVPDKLEFQKKHKFALAFENTASPGYLTEKIVQAYAAQTVPIYWGDPHVGKMFNPKSFINVADFNSLDQVVEYVKMVDNDDALYMKMLKEPAFINQSCYRDEFIKKFDKWLCNIFDQDIESAYRRNMHYWGLTYQNDMLEKNRAYMHSMYYMRKMVKQNVEVLKKYLRKIKRKLLKVN